MPKDLTYGPRLTDDEYERRIVELHRDLPPMPTKDQDKEVRRRELNLAIDHRLGRDFPPERREALWAVKERVEKRRLRLGVKLLLKKFFGKSVADDSRGLVGYMVNEYGKVLNKNELNNFFALDEEEHPTK